MIAMSTHTNHAAIITHQQALTACRFDCHQTALHNTIITHSDTRSRPPPYTPGGVAVTAADAGGSAGGASSSLLLLSPL
jgi:hypothetical protein